MAIQQPIKTQTFKLQDEVASRVILLTRDVIDNQNGSVTINFGGAIHPKSITYELDTEDNKIGIYESADLDGIVISSEQLMQLFGIKVTLADGTVSYIGEVISNFTDQIISARVPDPGTITTQNIDINAVLTAQTVPEPTPISDPDPTA